MPSVPSWRCCTRREGGRPTPFLKPMRAISDNARPLISTCCWPSVEHRPGYTSPVPVQSVRLAGQGTVVCLPSGAHRVGHSCHLLFEPAMDQRPSAVAIAFAAFAIWGFWLSRRPHMPAAVLVLFLGVVA